MIGANVLIKGVSDPVLIGGATTLVDSAIVPMIILSWNCGIEHREWMKG
jgi:hypothetical protein